MVKVYIFICFLIQFYLSTHSVIAKTIRVPAEIKTIKEAIDISSDGDIVLLSDGIYKGENNKNIDSQGKAITLTSENGPLNCIIDCEGDGRAFHFQNNETQSTVLDGVTILNGNMGAPYYESGGGILCSNAGPIIANCIIKNNIGGGKGGGISIQSFSGDDIYPVVKNCLILNNYAVPTPWPAGPKFSYGMGISCYGENAFLLIINCTLFNQYDLGPANIGEVYIKFAPVKIINSIIWPVTNDQIVISNTDAVSVSYCDVKDGYFGEANIKDSPLFKDSDNEDFHLTPHSPCINTGNNENAPEKDLEGNLRPICNTVDIGVYEYVACDEDVPNIGSSGTGGGCFIATAAYGSPLQTNVKILHEFRDRFLLVSKAGKYFVRAYYTYSPPIANFIAKHDNLRMFVRLSLLPVVGISWVSLKIGLVYNLALFLLLCSGLIGFVIFRRKFKK